MSDDSSPKELKALSPAQEQARLRRERRNAKIQASGASRLEAITSLSGRKGPPPETTSQSSATARTTNQSSTPPIEINASHTPDPDEVDISQDVLRTTQSRSSDISARNHTENQALQSDDPMMQLMQQMLGASGGQPGARGEAGHTPSDPIAGLPPALSQLLGAQQQARQESEAPTVSSAYLWRIIHAVFSLLLGIYVAFDNTFTGSRSARFGSRSNWRTAVDKYDISDDTIAAVTSNGAAGKRLFWIFATSEILLQSTRYYIERGRLPGSGILAGLAGFLPPPYSEYIRVLGRYSVIFSTIAADAMVLVFVLGVSAWWAGTVES